MKAYVGITDGGWYRLLRATGPTHAEVNFWFPSANAGFGAISAGEPFVFKTHVDRRNPAASNRLVGAGTFSGFARMTASEAWDLLGLANGVSSHEELRERTAHYRRTTFERLEDPVIGCVLLREVVFFGDDDSLAAPADFATTGITRGKAYDLTEIASPHSVVEAILRYRLQTASEIELSPATHGTAALTVPRIGQQAFKAVIADRYGHHCAITGDRVRPVLQAAHILPIAAGGEHRVDNGLLLRSDVHTLFDKGYIGVDTRLRLRVSPALRERFGNGDWFYSHEGSSIEVPDRRADRPNREFLEWHNDEVFLRA